MDIPPFYLTASAAWLFLQAIPLFITPKLIISSLAPDEHTTTATEIYLARLLSLSLLTLSLLPIFTPTSPSTRTILTLFHIITFIYIYTTYLFLSTSIPTITPSGTINSTPPTIGLILGLIGYGTLSITGIWTLVFGTAPSHVSKRTGADKRTSGFPFKNAGAYDKKRDYAAVGGGQGKTL